MEQPASMLDEQFLYETSSVACIIPVSLSREVGTIGTIYNTYKMNSFYADWKNRWSYCAISTELQKSIMYHQVGEYRMNVFIHSMVSSDENYSKTT